MTALSIRRMNFTLQAMEHIKAQQDTVWYESLPASVRNDRTHYWHIQRKAKRGKNKWIFVREYFGTKSEAATFFQTYYKNREETFRLRHMLAY